MQNAICTDHNKRLSPDCTLHYVMQAITILTCDTLPLALLDMLQYHDAQCQTLFISKSCCEQRLHVMA